MRIPRVIRLVILVLIFAGIRLCGVAEGSTAIWAGDGTNSWWRDSKWTVDGIADQPHPGTNNTTIITNGICRKSYNLIGGNSTYQFGGTGTFAFDKQCTVGWDDVRVSDNFTLTATYIFMSKDYSGSTPSKVEMSGGTIMLSETNAFRGINFSKVWFNLTGDAGSITIKQTDSKLASGTSLAEKVAMGYFRLDGVRINPSANGKDLDVLNAELKTLSSNERYLVVSQQGDSQILEIKKPSVGVVIILH